MMSFLSSNTQHGRSRPQHVRDREADIESAKNWRLVNLRRSICGGEWVEFNAPLDTIQVISEAGDMRGPQGRAHIWVVFSCKGAEGNEWRGPKGQANALVVVVLWRKDYWATRPIGPSRWAHFCGVWSKTPNSSPRRLTIGCFQGNQYVILSSTVLCRATAFQQTVLPPSCAGYGLEIQNECVSPKTVRTQKLSAPWVQNWGRNRE